MKAKEYDLLDRCVENGVALGYRRAHKHTEKPEEDDLFEQIRQAVMGEICEWFDFDLPGENVGE
jgi:hypothetical protein